MGPIGQGADWCIGDEEGVRLGVVRSRVSLFYGRVVLVACREGVVAQVVRRIWFTKCYFLGLSAYIHKGSVSVAACVGGWYCRYVAVLL